MWNTVIRLGSFRPFGVSAANDEAEKDSEAKSRKAFYAVLRSVGSCSSIC